MYLFCHLFLLPDTKWPRWPECQLSSHLSHQVSGGVSLNMAPLEMGGPLPALHPSSWSTQRGNIQGRIRSLF